MTAIIVAAGVALLVGFLWREGKKPARHSDLSPERLEKLLVVLLHQGYDGGVLFVEQRRGANFLQVSKYIGAGKVGLQLDFPRAEWSEGVFPKVREILTVMRTAYEETSMWRPDSMHFLTVDFGKDARKAAEVVYALATQALGMDMPHGAVAYFQNVSSDPGARIGF